MIKKYKKGVTDYKMSSKNDFLKVSSKNDAQRNDAPRNDTTAEVDDECDVLSESSDNDSGVPPRRKFGVLHFIEQPIVKQNKIRYVYPPTAPVYSTTPDDDVSDDVNEVDVDDDGNENDANEVDDDAGDVVNDTANDDAGNDDAGNDNYVANDNYVSNDSMYTSQSDANYSYNDLDEQVSPPKLLPSYYASSQQYPHSTNYRKREIICSNCRKKGHYQRNCKKPIQSFGIIAVQLGNPVKYLLIRRRNSIGYETFLRGRYDNEDQMMKLIERMTESEKVSLATTSFDQLWDDLCVIRDSKFYKHGKKKAKELFEKLPIAELFKDTTSEWKLPAWGLPKGRRYTQETDFQCASREFIEETNFDRAHFRLLFTKPFTELYTGTNGVRYKHTYYLALTSNKAPEPVLSPDNKYQIAEVGDIGWFTLEESLELIRPYNEEKKQVLREASEVIQEYLFPPYHE